MRNEIGGVNGAIKALKEQSFGGKKTPHWTFMRWTVFDCQRKSRSFHAILWKRKSNVCFEQKLASFPAIESERCSHVEIDVELT